MTVEFKDLFPGQVFVWQGNVGMKVRAVSQFDCDNINCVWLDSGELDFLLDFDKVRLANKEDFFTDYFFEVVDKGGVV